MFAYFVAFVDFFTGYFNDFISRLTASRSTAAKNSFSSSLSKSQGKYSSHSGIIPKEKFGNMPFLRMMA